MFAPLPQLPSRHRQAQTERDNATSHKIDYVTQRYGILNPEGFLNSIVGSKVTAILADQLVELPQEEFSTNGATPSSLFTS